MNNYMTPEEKYRLQQELERGMSISPTLFGELGATPSPSYIPELGGAPSIDQYAATQTQMAPADSMDYQSLGGGQINLEQQAPAEKGFNLDAAMAKLASMGAGRAEEKMPEAKLMMGKGPIDLTGGVAPINPYAPTYNIGQQSDMDKQKLLGLLGLI